LGACVGGAKAAFSNNASCTERVGWGAVAQAPSSAAPIKQSKNLIAFVAMRISSAKHRTVQVIVELALRSHQGGFHADVHADIRVDRGLRTLARQPCIAPP
jgi:hypothetical protein